MIIGLKKDDVDAVTSASVRNSFKNNVNYIKYSLYIMRTQ